MTITRTKSWKTIAAAALGLGLAVLSAGPAAAAVTLSSGHIDALAFSYDESGQELDIQVNDHPSATPYDPAEVTFDVHDGHSMTLVNPVSCRADAGENWVVPRTEASGLLWLGWNTDGVDLADFGGSLQTELVGATIPSGGNVSVYDSATGVVRFHTDSACNAAGTDITESHHHPSWVFTEPGTYELTFQVTGEHVTDGTVTSDPITYTFNVGGA